MSSMIIMRVLNKGRLQSIGAKCLFERHNCIQILHHINSSANICAWQPTIPSRKFPHSRAVINLSTMIFPTQVPAKQNRCTTIYPNMPTQWANNPLLFPLPNSTFATFA